MDKYFRGTGEALALTFQVEAFVTPSGRSGILQRDKKNGAELVENTWREVGQKGSFLCRLWGLRKKSFLSCHLAQE